MSFPGPDHSSKMVLPAVQLSPPEEARTPRKDRYAKNHRAPNHISKTSSVYRPLRPTFSDLRGR